MQHQVSDYTTTSDNSSDYYSSEESQEMGYESETHSYQSNQLDDIVEMDNENSND